MKKIYYVAIAFFIVVVFWGFLLSYSQAGDTNTYRPLPGCPPCDSCCPDCPDCPDPPPCPECPDPPDCPPVKPCPECPDPPDCPPVKPCPECPNPKPCPPDKPCPKCPPVSGDNGGGSNGDCCNIPIRFHLAGDLVDEKVWCAVPRLNDQLLFPDGTRCTVATVVWYVENNTLVEIYCEPGVTASLNNIFSDVEKASACFIDALR